MQALSELLGACFAPVNLIYTLPLIAMLLYWLSVIAGALDISVLDVDLDLNGELDADLDTELGAEGDVGDVGDTGLRAILRYFNVGEVPLTILLSFFITSLWTTGMLANWYLHRNASIFMGLIVLVPNVIVSLHVAKFLGAPFKALFGALDKDAVEQEEDLVGRRCTVTTSSATPTFGQAEVQTKGAPLLLSVRTDGEVLAKGTSAVIMDFNKDKGLYTITKLELEV